MFRSSNIAITGARRCYSTLKYARYRYDETIPNLGVNKESRVIVQGFTGRVSTVQSQIAIDTVGTNIVGGVSPKHDISKPHLGLPVYKTVKDAAQHLKPDVSLVFVPALGAADAIIDAIEAEIPLIVAVAEGVPQHDQMRVRAALQSQAKSRLVGANTAGMINPSGCKLGIQPAQSHKPGKIGIVSKSGTLSYEIANITSQLGLGQSYVIGVGGDPFPGTTTVDALKFLLEEKNTKGIILAGEIGGRAEIDVAEYLSALKSGLDGDIEQKPIVGFLAGLTTPPRRIMGHAGAMWEEGLNDDANYKLRRWKDVGINMAPDTTNAGYIMNDLLK